MRTVCNLDMCTGCMACVDRCPNGAIVIRDSLKAYNAVIDTSKCIECDLCRRVCQVFSKSEIKFRKPIAWWQGWAEDAELRSEGSSGGIAGTLSWYFIANGGCVCSCSFDHGVYGFEVIDDVERLKNFSGSKYIKSDPTGMYQKIEERCKKNIPVLLIGLPCQIAAAKKVFGNKYGGLLYTVDLICHGSPSPRLLAMFLREYGFKLEEMGSVTFRQKSKYALFQNRQQIAMGGIQDEYTYAFLNSLDYTENCYHCQYARLERVSDLTIGDSWGTQLTEEKGKGVSLILCQTQAGQKLLDQSHIHAEPVDVQTAVENNHQLQHPSIAPKQRSKFFATVEKGSGFRRAISKCYPRFYYKQILKKLLIKLNLIKSK